MIARRIQAWLLPVAALALALAGWAALTWTAIVPGFLLPAPERVAVAMARAMADPLTQRHLWATLQATVAGYAVGCAIAIVLAAAIAEFKPFERFLFLPLTAIQAIPKVSIAPLIFLWAGFDIGGKVLLVALIVFFPVFTNALVGFRAADPNLLALLTASGAGRVHRFWTVKAPSAASQIFAGLEIAVSFALIGCVVMEFVGATRGMGFLIQDASNTSDLPLVFAAIVGLGLIGVAGNALVRLIHRRVVFWERAGKTEGA